MRLFFAAVIVALASSSARAECPTEFELVLIADDTGDLRLTGPPPNTIKVMPSINTVGNVAFAPFLDAGGQVMLVGDENNLVERLRDRTADPASDWVSLGTPLLGVADRLVFLGRLDDGANLQPYAAIADILNSGELKVQSDPSRGASAPDISSAGPAFPSSNGLNDHQIVAVPEATPLIEESGEPNGYGGISYAGRDKFTYVTRDGADQVLKTSEGFEIARTRDSQPPSGATRGFRGGVAYTHGYVSQDNPGFADIQILRWSSDTQASTVIADSGDGDFGLPILSLPMFASLMDKSPDASTGGPDFNRCVVFAAEGREGRDTIFVADDDGVTAVIEEGGDLFDGEPVGQLAMIPQGVNSRGQIAFWAGGLDRQWILRADPVGLGPGDPGDPADPDDGPIEDEACGCSTSGAPGSAGLLVAALLLGFRRRR